MIKSHLNRLGVFLGAFEIILNIISIVFMFNFKNINAIIVAIVIEFFVIFLLSTLVTALEFKNNKACRLTESEQVARNFTNVIEKAYKKGEYETVLSYGGGLDRVLYLSGCYQSRIKIGGFVASAAKNLDRLDIEAKAYLDMIGWTKVLIRDKTAINDIQKGIAIAQSNRDVYLEAKGRRHLFAIYGKNKDNQNLKKEEDQILQLLERMPAGNRKDTFYAGYLYGKADVMCYTRQYNYARDLCDQSYQIRKKNGDASREIRFFSQRGKIEYFSHNIDNALSFFSIGENKALDEDRVDEIIKNKYGKALCLLERHPAEAKSLVTTVNKQYGHVRLSPLDEILIEEYNSKTKKTR